jgi:hypothetical protein
MGRKAGGPEMFLNLFLVQVNHIPELSFGELYKIVAPDLTFTYHTAAIVLCFPCSAPELFGMAWRRNVWREPPYILAPINSRCYL